MDPNKNEILLDTNTFGKFLKREVDFEKLKNWKMYCTTAQWAEIDNTHDEKEREILQGIFKVLGPLTINSPVTAYGLGFYDVSRYAETNETDNFDKFKEEIRQLDLDAEMKGKKKLSQLTPEQRELNWAADAMVIQGAMKVGKSCFLITNDKTLRTLASDKKVRSAKLRTFIEDVNKPENLSHQ